VTEPIRGTLSEPDPSPSSASTAVETLPVLPLPDGVVLPEMVVTISIQSAEATAAVEAAAQGRVLLVTHLRGGGYARVGAIGTIENRAELPDGTPTLTIRAHHRARVGTGVIGATSGLWVEAEPVADPAPTEEHESLAAEYRAAATSLLDKIGGRRMSSALREIDSPGALADSIGYWPELSTERRVQLLETVDVADRLRLAIAWVKEALAELETRERIQREVTDDLEKTQREAILRRQLSAIRSELDEGDDDVIGDYRARLDAIADEVTEAATSAVAKEIDRLERTGNESMEANWIRTWLDTVFDLPWGVRSDEQLDLDVARRTLDADHTGLDEVKDRLIEFLAVRKLRSERGVSDGGRDRRRGGVILALAGPPGVGKTSLGESVARALGREFVRLSLGGIRDEAEIRGHRRTYVGARPGRLVRALTEAGSMNPVVLLDEIDKVSAGWQGDPSAALLEVLDPAQNATFRDHYLEFELDLSDVVFLATANVLDTIPGPLLDRMEIIGLDGYTASEKAAIARDHLLPRLVERNGLRPGEVVIGPATIDAVAADYTREAGVRHLERLLDKLVRKAVTRIAGGEPAPIGIQPDQLRELLGRPVPTEEVTDRIDRPGIATGLAVTGAGGDVLFVETALVDGSGEPLLTGQLGEVMKESASIARSVVGAHGARLGITFPDDKRLHVHFPAGAVPKDGPSAGITMTTALVSLLSGRAVRSEVGMTGEVTLQGRVLPIGGVKQKLLAAHRAGLTEVILPAANGDDLDEVPEEVTEDLTIHLAGEIDQVLRVALGPAPADAVG
jgi:ATP-dependent Lon protease